MLGDPSRHILESPEYINLTNESILYSFIFHPSCISMGTRKLNGKGSLSNWEKFFQLQILIERVLVRQDQTIGNNGLTM